MGELTKIVSRPVYDVVVQNKLRDDEETYRDYFERIDVYQKNVTTTLPRIELSRSAGGLLKKTADCTFKAVLQQLMAGADSSLPCELKWAVDEGKSLSYKVSLRVIKVLKALAITQVSSSQEFADVMACIFMQMVKGVVVRSSEYAWEPDVNFSSMQEVVYDSTTKYITKFLAG